MKTKGHQVHHPARGIFKKRDELLGAFNKSSFVAIVISCIAPLQCESCYLQPYNIYFLFDIKFTTLALSI